MTIRQFSDTSAVSLAYALSDASKASELPSNLTLTYLPFTSEGFSMSKESVNSTAIRGNRRISGSKNTRGSAAGAATIEFGSIQFTLDMLQLLMMNTWKPVDGADADAGQYIYDSNILQTMMVEKVTRPGGKPTDKQYLERYYGMAASDGTLDLADAALVTLATNFMGIFAESANQVQGANGLGGSVATEKLLPEQYEIADSSNNLENLVITDTANLPLEVTFQSAQLQIQNNTREQNALGSVFASGIGIGKVNVQLSGDMYFYDQTILDVHMNNQRVKGQMTIDTQEGTFTIYLPNLMAQSPSNNAQGENQDYMTSITLMAEEGTVTVGAGLDVVCSILIKYVAKE